MRVVEKDGEPWFVAKDVGEILGFSNVRVEVSRLDEDERGESQIVTPSNGGYSKVNIISESGLYTLIMRSNKPEAKKFARWVTHEVLPSIRKTGMYLSDKAVNAEKMTLTNREGHSGQLQGWKSVFLPSRFPPDFSLQELTP